MLLIFCIVQKIYGYQILNAKHKHPNVNLCNVYIADQAALHMGKEAQLSFAVKTLINKKIHI